jgi:hypothetical protein
LSLGGLEKLNALSWREESMHLPVFVPARLGAGTYYEALYFDGQGRHPITFIQVDSVSTAETDYMAVAAAAQEIKNNADEESIKSTS